MKTSATNDRHNSNSVFGPPCFARLAVNCKWRLPALSLTFPRHGHRPDPLVVADFHVRLRDRAVVRGISGTQPGPALRCRPQLHRCAALLLAWFGFYLQSKPANEFKTFGYHRAGVLSAFVNALTLIALAALIFYESYQRLQQPQPVQRRS